MINDSIARNRLGLGARLDEKPPTNPRRWLLAQLDDYDPLPTPWRSVQRTWVRTREWGEQQDALRKLPEVQRDEIREAYLRKGRAAYLAGVEARTISAIQSDVPFVERLCHFWSNHFAISVEKFAVMGLAASFEADAIRPNVLGRFEDLLLAVVRHPAMLLFLDQATSIGPSSNLSTRGKMPGRPSRGLNENLAREILELHTLGVRSGYTQVDVIELARALTGWTLPAYETSSAADKTFEFRADLHEPGARMVLGRNYAADDERQASAVLRDLAKHPATASHIATKLVCHFVTDDPPQALVKRLSEKFLETDGNLIALCQELVAGLDSLNPVTAKFKSPWDWTISAMRALGVTEMPGATSSYLMGRLGQPIWRPGTPAGYGDIAATWAAPDALLRRVETAQRFSIQFGRKIDARAIAPRILPDSLSQVTADAIASAESPSNALALLLASPDFLRR